MPQINSIKDLNPIKNKIRKMLKMFNFFYTKTIGQTMHETVKYSGNPVVQEIYKAMIETLKDIDDFEIYQSKQHKEGEEYRKDRYREMVRSPIEIALVFYYADTAYRDMGDLMLYRFLKSADKLLPYLEEQMKKPEHMYFNIWQDMQRETVEGQKDGSIMEGQLSDGEYIMVDSINKEQERLHHKRIVKQVKKADHW